MISAVPGCAWCAITTTGLPAASKTTSRRCTTGVRACGAAALGAGSATGGLGVHALELSALATRLTSSQGASGTRHSGIVVRADRNGNSVALNRLASALAAARIDNWSIAVTPEGAP